MLVYLIAALLGLTLSAVWAWYIKAVAEEKIGQAVMSDAVLLILTFAQYQLWASRDNDMRVFLAITAGAVLGTYLYLKWKRVQRTKHLAVSDRYARTSPQAPCAS